MTAAPPSAPAIGLAVRRAVAVVSGAHRRVEGVVAPALSAAPLASGRRQVAPAGRPPAPPRAPAAAHPLPDAAAPRPRPAMVLRPAAGAATAVAPVAEPPAARAATATATPSGRVLSELDVEAFTDRIVQQIDRRIVAHRERLGRI